MGGSQAAAADAAMRQDQELMQKEFDLSQTGLTSAFAYGGQAYKSGGFDQSAKYSAMLDQTIDRGGMPVAGGSLAGMGTNTADMEAARALGISGVGQGKILSAVDEMNKLRSLLSSNGLKTTGLGAEAGATSNYALGLMPKESPGLSAGLGLAAAGAGIYGGLSKPGAPDTSGIKPVSAFTGSFLGSDVSLERAGGPSSFSLFGGGPSYFNTETGPAAPSQG